MNFLNKLLGYADPDRITDDESPELAEFLETDRKRRKALPDHDKAKHREPSVGDITRAQKRGEKRQAAAMRKMRKSYRKVAMARQVELTAAANAAIDAIAEGLGRHREWIVTAYFAAHPEKPSATPVEIGEWATRQWGFHGPNGSTPRHRNYVTEGDIAADAGFGREEARA